MKKRILALTLGTVMAAGTLAGCGEKAPAPTAGAGEQTTAAAPAGETKSDGGQSEASGGDGAELSGDLVFAIWDNNLMDYIDENDMVGKFQEKYPDANIEVAQRPRRAGRAGRCSRDRASPPGRTRRGPDQRRT